MAEHKEREQTTERAAIAEARSLEHELWLQRAKTYDRAAETKKHQALAEPLTQFWEEVDPR